MGHGQWIHERVSELVLTTCQATEITRMLNLSPFRLQPGVWYATTSAASSG